MGKSLTVRDFLAGASGGNRGPFALVLGVAEVEGFFDEVDLGDGLGRLSLLGRLFGLWRFFGSRGFFLWGF